MSAYDSFVVGKLKLKGKALDVKASGIKKKKKMMKHDKIYHHLSQNIAVSGGVCYAYVTGKHARVRVPINTLSKWLVEQDEVMQTAKDPENRYSKRKETLKYGGNMSTDHHEDSINEADKYVGKENGASYDDHLTPAERRFLQQTQKLERQRLAKMASRSHRDRIQEFNQYLANLSEHYDIPKVGPG